MVIEKYKSPVGDGTDKAFLTKSSEIIEKYKSPVGDGNKFVFAVNAT